MSRQPLPMGERVQLWHRAMRELLSLTTARLSEQQQSQQQAEKRPAQSAHRR